MIIFGQNESKTQKTRTNVGKYGNLVVLAVFVFTVAVPGKLAAAAQAKQDKRATEPIEGAKKEGKLMVYGGGSASRVRRNEAVPNIENNTR